MRHALSAAPLALVLMSAATIAQETRAQETRVQDTQVQEVRAQEMGQVATISILGAPLKIFGAIYVDPALHRAFLTDRSNKSVDILDTLSNKFLVRVGGFVGLGTSGDASGPQGVATVDGKEVWATDGDSTVKVIDLSTNKIVDTIATGGKNRTGELVYDPQNHVMLATNPDEPTQFVSLISTEPGHRIVAKISFPKATEGIERSAYSDQTGHFYVPLPSLDPARKAGGLADIDPQGKLVAVYPTDHCNPHSVTVISPTRVFIGCNYGPADATGQKGQMVVLNVETGKIVARAASLGGDGQTAIDLAMGRYYAAANKEPGGSVVKIVDVASQKPVQILHTWFGSHSVAVDDRTHRLYLPVAAGTAPCGGCVVVFGIGGAP
jgi:hypothetical protein